MNFGWIALLAFVTLCSGAIGSGNNDTAKLAAFVFFPSAIALYLSPTIVAHQRQHQSATAITVLNILLGWTLLGWIAAIVWAYTAPAVSPPRETEASAKSSSPPAEDFTSGTKICPFCAETIQAEAIKCRYCGSDLNDK